MNARRISAERLRQFVEQVFERAGYSPGQAVKATDVLMWASLRGVDTHGVRNLKPYYIDRTLAGLLKPDAQIQFENETPHTACLNGDSGLGLTCACHAMRVAIDKSESSGVGIVCVRNTHHLGPAGYYAHMAVRQGMIGICATGHFFGKGHSIGIAPLGTLLPMLSTNPFSFAVPCGRHPSFVLDMSTSIATINRIEMYGQQGRPIPTGWARDIQGNLTTDASAACIVAPLGGTAELGAYKGTGLAMMVSILSGVLSRAWAPLAQPVKLESRTGVGTVQYDQPTMGHFFAAVKIDSFQPLESFHAAMDAMIDALHAAPASDPSAKVSYPGEIESATAAERSTKGIPLSEYLFAELQALGMQFDLKFP
jgi:LDH2 family malate/lactate/ureidoglycolate dehydrogenase